MEIVTKVVIVALGLAELEGHLKEQNRNRHACSSVFPKTMLSKRQKTNYRKHVSTLVQPVRNKDTFIKRKRSEDTSSVLSKSEP